jgi:hypothetical protein
LLQNKYAILILLITTSLSAKTSYEIDVHYGFGTSELSYNSVPGIALSIYPTKNFAFSAGLEYSWRWQTKTNNFASGTNPPALDNEKHPYILSYEIYGYEERFIGKILQVPLFLKYSDESYYVAGGFKIGSVKEARVNISYDSIKTKGDYTDFKLPNLTDPLFQGFGKQNDSSFSTKISASKILIMLAIEGGVKFKLNDKFSAVFGAFVDYSLNKSFDKKLPPIVERVQLPDSAYIATNHSWKSWRPWSVGAVVKLSFMHEPRVPQLEDLHEEEAHAQVIDTIHIIKLDAELAPPPVPLSEPLMPEPVLVMPPALQGDSFSFIDLPAFLLNRKPDFEFHYPESRTSPSDSLHLAIISQIADTLRAVQSAQLHCVGHSERLLSESVAYETALQRSLRIRYTLTRFYGISENRVFIYSQGSKSGGYRRAECFVIEQ